MHDDYLDISTILHDLDNSICLLGSCITGLDHLNMQADELDNAELSEHIAELSTTLDNVLKPILLRIFHNVDLLGRSTEDETPDKTRYMSEYEPKAKTEVDEDEELRYYKDLEEE